MAKSNYLKEFQKRLPDDIEIEDETKFEINEDEYLSILSWLKYFKEHYKIYGKEIQTFIQFPIISKRLRLDFGLYNIPSNLETSKGKYIIYIAENGKLLNGKTKKISTIEMIKTWDL